MFNKLFDNYLMKHEQKKILVLFDGSGCISKMAKNLGYHVKSLDILNLDHIDIPIDILQFNPEDINGFIPDVIWASPPCETWSIVTAMKGGGNRYWESIKLNGKVVDIKPRTNFTIDKRLKYPDRIIRKRITHTDILIKTVDIINHYQVQNPNLIYFIENPATGYMRFYLKKLIPTFYENITTYCKYGSQYRKETSIFSNLKLNLKWCPKKSKTNTCHHSDTFQQRYDHKKQPKGVVKHKSYLERSSIPDKLCKDILCQTHRELSFIFD